MAGLVTSPGSTIAPRWMAPVAAIHERHVHQRRVSVLARHAAAFLPSEGRAIDVGAGDGQLSPALAAWLPRLAVTRLDVVVRGCATAPVFPFDGVRLPFRDDSFDAALLVDVLHHARDPIRLLEECRRVAPIIVIKDHLRDGLFADATLRVMDWIGNAPHGIPMTYRYWSRAEWDAAWDAARLRVLDWRGSLDLYPRPAHWLFDRGLHFLARLGRTA